MIKISYDREGDVLEIRFSEEPITESEHVEESGLVVDYGKKGKMVALEIISFSRRVGLDHTVKVLSV